ncbi:Peroxisomal membrane protein PAS20 [Epicoccum nigrum]|nr:Peroxisomal membrane protein PAS20 [Epicoccum nigrum]
MSAPSPPKPWETSGGATSASVGLTGSNNSTTTQPTSAGAAPPLPSVPDSLSTVANRNASTYSNPNMNRGYGASPYSSYGGGGYSSYSSPYGMSSMYGSGYGGGMYGGMGGMGGMGMGGMYGGMGGMGGMPMDPNNPQSLTQSFSQSTQATFQLIENIVGAFGGFAQMLQSTYMATHSSFFAMVSVAEQFGTLKQTLGSVLGIFTLMRWIRTAFAKLTGRPMPADAMGLTPAGFAAFTGKLPDGSPAPPKPSKKPFFFFLAAVFGLPYLMGKLIQALARSQEEAEKQRMLENPQAAVDPNKLEFCRALYDFTPDSNMSGMDLAIKKGDMVAVLSKSDPMGNASEWWKCRSRDGRMGYLPGIYLETIQRKQPAQITSGSQSGSPAGSRAQTMTSSSATSRTATMTGKPVEGPKVEGKAGDMGVESFQKGAFYS